MLAAAAAFAVVFLAQTGVESPGVTEGAIAFTAMMFRLESLYISTAAYVVIQAMSKVDLAKHAIASRLKPFAPAVLTTAMAFFPSFRLGAWDETLLYGLSIGAFIGWGYKLVAQSIFGQDHRIKGRIDDPELQELIDEYFKAKQRNTMSEKTKVSLRARLEDLLT